LLPFSTTDQLVVFSRDTNQTRKISGVIEDISGHAIVIRRDATEVEVFTLRDVIRMDFRKSVEFDDGLRSLHGGDYRKAIDSLKAAVAAEPRPWAVREAKAILARALISHRQFHDALSTIESILESDPNTRHVVELPLVWDERLPIESRIDLAADDLRSDSASRKLTAASLHLQNETTRSESAAALRELAKSSNPQIQKLAETQLWRMKLFSPASLKDSEVDLWHRQIGRLDRRMRSGPEFLCGRAHLLLNDYDRAVTSLLWMPVLEPLDPETTKASLTDAITALELSGRKQEADFLRASPVLNPAR
jgi:tetratricopeptide (TPR) repeat protein